MIPQMILIRLLNHLFFIDSLKSKIPPRILVTMEMNPMMAITIIIATKEFPHDVSVSLNTKSIIHTEPTIEANCTIAEIHLMIFANHVCFIASFINKIAPRTAPIMKIALNTCIPMGKVADVATVGM